MNTKLTVKKLRLLKETLRDLTAKNAGAVKGGSPSLRGPTWYYTCTWKGKTKNCQTNRPAC